MPEDNFPGAWQGDKEVQALGSHFKDVRTTLNPYPQIAYHYAYASLELQTSQKPNTHEMSRPGGARARGGDGRRF